MDIKDVKYLFTKEGGGWGRSHKLYIITQKDEVYYTDIYDSQNILSCNPTYVCPLYDKNRENFCISSETSWENGNKTVVYKYLFDLLNPIGKVDFEKPNSFETIMDAETITMYKNNKGTLKKIWEADDYNIDAVSYVSALCSKYCNV